MGIRVCKSLQCDVNCECNCFFLLLTLACLLRLMLQLADPKWGVIGIKFRQVEMQNMRDNI